MWVLIKNNRIVGTATLPPTADHSAWTEIPESNPLWLLYHVNLAQQARIDHLNASCNAAIVEGFWSDALGTPHRYSSQLEDQFNLSQARDAGIDMPYVCTDQQGLKMARPHTTAQIQQVYQDGFGRKSALIFYFHSLRLQVEQAQTLEAIAAIEWNPPAP